MVALSALARPALVWPSPIRRSPAQPLSGPRLALAHPTFARPTFVWLSSGPCPSNARPPGPRQALARPALVRPSPALPSFVGQKKAAPIIQGRQCEIDP